MSLFRLLLLAGIAILIGACGSNDQDISQEVGEAEDSPQYVMPDDQAQSDQVLTQEPDPSRDVNEEVVPTPETGTELEPEQTDPMTDSTAPESNPEDGMPQEGDLPQ